MVEKGARTKSGHQENASELAGFNNVAQVKLKNARVKMGCTREEDSLPKKVTKAEKSGKNY